jgi:hypothetical protein
MKRRDERFSRHLMLFVSLAVLVSTRPAAAGHGFVGETRCANPTCHGVALPSDPAAQPGWRPWKSARTQWLNRNIDRHSRAFATLEGEDSKRIARYMGIEATSSDKCLACHAPAAAAAPGGRHRRQDGVSCEHCHGPAEEWLEPHAEKTWPQKRAQFLDRGFYDNNDLALRAEKCASCHLEIDHEIVAGGHPPLQFEMVAYAQIMKHWDDADERTEGAFSLDPTIWSVGQVVGLRQAAMMIERRAGEQNYQSIGRFAHFEQRECYQCHHKLVADALRQAAGHYAMVKIIAGALEADSAGEIDSRWAALAAAVPASADLARVKAQDLEASLRKLEEKLLRTEVQREAARAMLLRITSAGDQAKGVRRFAWERVPRSNVLRIENIDLPWWYTTGAPEQTALAIQALCEPVAGRRCDDIYADLRALVGAADRENFQAQQFSRSLGEIHRKLSSK